MSYGTGEEEDPRLANWGKRTARKLMAQVACSVVGHHYLKGGKGNRPSQPDGAFCRPSQVTLLKQTGIDKLAFYAGGSALDLKPKATKEVPDPKSAVTTFVCGGNYTALGRPPIAPSADLINYLKDQDPRDPGRCYTRAGFTPRKVVDGSAAKPIVWGQSCDGWRHFDCLGLVDFAIWKLRRVDDKETRTVAQWASPKNAVNATKIPDYDPVLDGDLVSLAEKRLPPHRHLLPPGRRGVYRPG